MALKQLIIIIASLATASAVIDGISFRVHQEIIDKALVALEPAIITIAKTLIIDDVDQSLTVGSAFLSNIKILDLKFATPPRAHLDKDQLCMRSDKVKTTIKMDILVRLLLLSFNYHVEADVTIPNFSMCVTVDLDTHHKFVVRIADHTVVISDMNLTITDENGKEPTIINSILGLVKESIRSSINSFLDKDLTQNVEKALEKQIELRKPRVYLSEKGGVFLDLTPTHAPVFLDGITYSTSGYTFQEKNWAIPYQHARKPTTLPEYQKGFGVTLYMNDFVIRNLVGVLWANTDLFAVSLTERSEVVPLDFTVEGFAKVFQKLDEKFPKHLPVEVKIRLSQAPNVRIRNDYISVFLRADVQVMVVLEDGSRATFGDFSVMGLVDAVISLEDIKILKIVPRASTRIEVDRFELYGVVVDRDLINQTVNGAVQLWINYFGFAHQTALEVIQKTIVFEKTHLRLEDNLLVFAANFAFNTVAPDFFSPKPKKPAAKNPIVRSRTTTSPTSPLTLTSLKDQEAHPSAGPEGKKSVPKRSSTLGAPTKQEREKEVVERNSGKDVFDRSLV